MTVSHADQTLLIVVAQGTKLEQSVVCPSANRQGSHLRYTWIISNQRAAFSSLPSTAFKIPVSGRGVALGGKLRIFSSMCRMSEKRSPWLA